VKTPPEDFGTFQTQRNPMPITYPHGKNHSCHPATDYSKVHDVLLAAVETYRPDLKAIKLTIDTVICENVTDEDGTTGPAVKMHGTPVAARIAVNSTILRAQGLADALILVDGHRWKEMAEAERLSLMHDMIAGIMVSVDDDGQTETDDQGRPKIKIKPFDYRIAGYAEVAKAHGTNSHEVIEYNQVVTSFGDVLNPELPPARLAPELPTRQAFYDRVSSAVNRSIADQ